MFIMEKTSKQKEAMKTTGIQHTELTSVAVYPYFLPVLSLYTKIYF